MTEPELNTRLQTITPPDEAARAAAHAHWAALAKPLGGLGSLETMLEDAAALTGTPELDFARRAVLVLCADNGVVAPGREPNRRQRDPRGAAKPCRAAHQRVPDGSCRPLQRCAGGYGHCRCPGARRAGLPHCPRHQRFYLRPGHDPRPGPCRPSAAALRWCADKSSREFNC